MRGFTVFFLVALSFSLFAQSALQEIEKTREYVLERLQTVKPQGNSLIMMEPQTTKNPGYRFSFYLLFDPEKVASTLKPCDFQGMILYLMLHQCELKSGSLSIGEDIYDYTDNSKLLFGIFVMSPYEMKVTFQFDLDVKLKRMFLYDFVRHWADDSGKDLSDYLLRDIRDVPEKYKTISENREGKMVFELKKETSFWEKGMYVWIYAVWAEFSIDRRTPAGMYSGVYTVKFEPLADFNGE
ncbi:MAG: hypothetical protein PWQ80_1041 [Thermotoga sp.]|jgi:hypothetical protein|nr:hypothetical protein [Thermotoga sp.]MDK2950069.1 hypothetical protein [Thermotoga sp.]